MNAREGILISLLLAIVLVAGLLRLNDLSLYTDSTRYVIWAHSVATGSGFVDDTLPIPSRFVMNAPLFPILLAPSQWFGGMSVIAAKIWTLLWGLAALAVFYFWLRRRFGVAASFLATAFLASSPLSLFLSTEVMSEGPFVALLMTTMFAFDVWSENPGKKAPRIVLVSSLVVLPFLREVGFAAVGAAAVVFLIRKSSRELRYLLISVGALYLIWALRNILTLDVIEQGQASNVQYLFRHFVTPPSQPLITEFVTRIWLNFQGYAFQIGGTVFYPFPSQLILDPSSLFAAFDTLFKSATPVFTVAGAISLGVGIFLDLREESSGLFRPLFIIFFSLILLVYPVHEMRFMFPLLPLILFYILLTARSVLKRVFGRDSFHPAYAATAGLLVIIPNVVCSVELIGSNRLYEGNPSDAAGTTGEENAASYYAKPWGLFSADILPLLPETSIVASPAKEIAPFLYPRKVLELSRTAPAPRFEQSLRDNAAEYLISTTVWDHFESYEFAINESHGHWFEPITSKGGLTLYKVHSSILEPAQMAAGPEEEDTTGAVGFFRRGRRQMLELDMSGAIHSFEQAIIRAPYQSEVAAQLAIAHAIVGDSVLATAVAQLLFTMPQSTAHSAMVQAHLDLMSKLLMARRVASPSQRSAMALNAARSYWDLGYRNLAMRIVRNILYLDPQNFDGLLWASYFSRELGDTASSGNYLADLKYVDITAQIIPALDRIDMLLGELRSARSPEQRASLHLGLAESYRSLELFEDALDETERSIRIAPDNQRAWNLRREIFMEKGAVIGAARAQP